VKEQAIFSLVSRAAAVSLIASFPNSLVMKAENILEERNEGICHEIAAFCQLILVLTQQQQLLIQCHL
jgi:hypothetical protein